MYSTIYHLIKISRPLNVVITALSVFIAAYISPLFSIQASLILAILSAALIAAGANTINDIYDVDIDKVNKPHRPLPAGHLSKKVATIHMGISYMAGLGLAFIADMRLFSIAVLTALFLLFYASHFKRTVLLGNFVVSICSALAFIYGALAVNDWQSGIFPALFAFFFHFGREIVKDMQDIRGDLSQNAITFAGQYGYARSFILVGILFTILIVTTILPYILSIYNLSYLIIVIAGVDIPLLLIMGVLYFSRTEKTLGMVSTFLKVDMLVGLLALYVGGRDVIFFN